ncbi:MAG: hypothetical protein IJ800_00250 [Clostridia bacterium]|nr:hypothetical protein [Clostridia bacterium]
MKNKAERTIYYSDEQNDEFAFDQKKDVEVGADFKYIRKNLIWNFLAFIAYRIIMTPIAFLYCKIKFRLKIENAEVLKPYRKKGVFIYGNHTLEAGDAFIPNLITFPQKTFVIVRSANISTKGTKNFIMMNGALPIPTKLAGMRNFMNALEKRILQGYAVMIYPEAHIWPYFTGIRNFKSVSMNYPVKFGAPSFTSTVTYVKPKRGNKPNIVVYVDGPFFPDEGLSDKEKCEDLKRKVFAKMSERAKLSNYEYIKYIKKEEKND